MFLRMETFYINIFFYSLVDAVCGEADVKIVGMFLLGMRQSWKNRMGKGGGMWM